jgi:hypothetical protein
MLLQAKYRGLSTEAAKNAASGRDDSFVVNLKRTLYTYTENVPGAKPR